MYYYPVFLNLYRKKVVVIGGGSVAERRVKELLKCGAIIHLYSKEISKKILNYRKKIKIHKRYSSSILDGSSVLFVATDDREFNRNVLVDATTKKIPINLSDDPKNSSFIIPSILRRGDITIAISTGGKAPALSKSIRKVLGLKFGREFILLTRGIEALRDKVKKRLNKSTERIKIFRESPLEELLQNIAGSKKKGAKKYIYNYLKKEEKRIDKILRSLK